MDLYIDQDYFVDGSRFLAEKCDEMKQLRSEIKTSFEQLRKEWDSEAGRLFFEKFEEDLLKNLDRYVIVFEYMSQNLLTASQKYDEVFRAVDTVTSAQY